MAKLARTEMGVEKLTAIADRGYYKSEEMLASHEAGITVYVPKTITSSATADGRFGRDDFIYDPQANEFRCPAGERLITSGMQGSDEPLRKADVPNGYRSSNLRSACQS